MLRRLLTSLMSLFIFALVWIMPKEPEILCGRKFILIFKLRNFSFLFPMKSKNLGYAVQPDFSYPYLHQPAG